MSRIEKPIPSLQEMCAKSLGKKAGSVSHTHVRNMLLGAHQNKTKSIQAQISRLQHLLRFYDSYIRAEIELKQDHYDIEWILSWNCAYNKETRKYEYSNEFKLPSRSIWEEDYFYIQYKNPGDAEHGSRILAVTMAMTFGGTNPVDALSGMRFSVLIITYQEVKKGLTRSFFFFSLKIHIFRV